MGGSQSAAQYTPVYSQDGYGKEEDDATAKPQPVPASFFRVPTLGDKVDAWFGFDKVSADALVTSCFVTPTALVSVRAFMLVYAACILVWHSLSVGSGTQWAGSMVSWTLVLTCVYFVTALVLTSIKVAGGYGNGTLLSDSVGLRFGYVLFEFSFTWSLATVALFWFTSTNKPTNSTELLQAFHLHGAALVFATMDLLISRVRFEFTHYIFCAATALLYVVANGVWFGVTANPMHGFKWNSLWSVLELFGVMCCVLVSFLAGAMLSGMRDFCYANHNHSLAVVMPAGSSVHESVHEDDVLPWPKEHAAHSSI